AVAFSLFAPSSGSARGKGALPRRSRGAGAVSRVPGGPPVVDDDGDDANLDRRDHIRDIMKQEEHRPGRHARDQREEEPEEPATRGARPRCATAAAGRPQTGGANASGTMASGGPQRDATR